MQTVTWEDLKVTCQQMLLNKVVMSVDEEKLYAYTRVELMNGKVRTFPNPMKAHNIYNIYLCSNKIAPNWFKIKYPLLPQQCSFLQNHLFINGDQEEVVFG